MSGTTTSERNGSLTAIALTGCVVLSVAFGGVALGTVVTAAANEPVPGENGTVSASFSTNVSEATVGEAVAFNASTSVSSGNITAYEWDFDDNGTTDATGETVTHAFASAGEYEVTLTVRDDANRTDSTSRTVAVAPDSTTPTENGSTIASFTGTTPLDENQSTPDDLAGKLRAESTVAANVSVELERNDTSNYTLSITAPEDARNVTFYLQEQAVSSSQNVENLTMYLDGEEHDYEVDASAGPGRSPWIAFQVPHFSTRTVTFTDGSADTGGTTHASGVAQSKFDIVAGTDGQLGRSDVVQMVGEYIDSGAVNGTQLTRGEVLDLVRYYITSGA
jgi:PKD repeat protein